VQPGGNAAIPASGKNAFAEVLAEEFNDRKSTPGSVFTFGMLVDDMKSKFFDSQKINQVIPQDDARSQFLFYYRFAPKSVSAIPTYSDVLDKADKEEYPEALSLCDSLHNIDQNNISLEAEHARLLGACHKFRDADAEYERLIRAGRQDSLPFLLSNYARNYDEWQSSIGHTSDTLKEANKRYEHARTADRASGVTWSNYALFAERHPDIANANSIYEEGLVHDPGSGVLNYSYGSFCIKQSGRPHLTTAAAEAWATKAEKVFNFAITCNRDFYYITFLTSAAVFSSPHSTDKILRPLHLSRSESQLIEEAVSISTLSPTMAFEAKKQYVALLQHKTGEYNQAILDAYGKATFQNELDVCWPLLLKYTRISVDVANKLLADNKALTLDSNSQRYSEQAILNSSFTFGIAVLVARTAEVRYPGATTKETGQLTRQLYIELFHDMGTIFRSATCRLDSFPKGILAKTKEQLAGLIPPASLVEFSDNDRAWIAVAGEKFDLAEGFEKKWESNHAKDDAIWHQIDSHRQ